MQALFFGVALSGELGDGIGMAADEGQRKLAAILAADVVGYLRLMADDERATVRRLTECRDIFTEHVEAHWGRVVDTAGDSVLATFERCPSSDNLRQPSF